MKKIFALLLILTSSLSLFADHYAGGEITWKCHPTNPNRYKFTLRIYRACEGASILPTAESIFVRNHPNVFQISCNFVSSRVISSPGCEVNAQACVVAVGATGLYEEITYESGQVNLGNFIPHIKGWWFYYVAPCCRPSQIVNYPYPTFITPSNSLLIRSAIFPIRKDITKPFPTSPVSVNMVNSNPNSSTFLANQNIVSAQNCITSYKNSPDFLLNPLNWSEKGKKLSLIQARMTPMEIL